jgi:hypothetical protein
MERYFSTLRAVLRKETTQSFEGIGNPLHSRKFLRRTSDKAIQHNPSITVTPCPETHPPDWAQPAERPLTQSEFTERVADAYLMERGVGDRHRQSRGRRATCFLGERTGYWVYPLALESLVGGSWLRSRHGRGNAPRRCFGGVSPLYGGILLVGFGPLHEWRFRGCRGRLSAHVVSAVSARMCRVFASGAEDSAGPSH